MLDVSRCGTTMSSSSSSANRWRGVGLHARPTLHRQPFLRCFAKLKIPQNHSKPLLVKPIQLDDGHLSTQALNPPRQFGPVRLDTVPGKGRGLFAQGNVAPCDLLLVSEPAGKVVCGPEGHNLRPEQLLAHLSAEGALSTSDRARLALLYDGTPEALRRPLALSDFMAGGAKEGEKGAAKQAAGPKGFGAPAKQAPRTLAPEDVAGEALQAIVRFNAWGAPHADLAAAPLRGQQSHSYIGIWPEFSLLNHSCAPNTVAVLVGDRILVRAATNIPDGGELTTSYLNEMGGAPLSERRRMLKSSYGFTCNCPRCKTEHAAPAAIRDFLEFLWAWMKEDGIATQAKNLLSSAAPADDPRLAQLELQLADHLAALERMMEEAQLDEQVRRWLRTSAYGCYELQAACQDELRGKQQEERVAAAGGASASGGSKAAAGAAPGRARPPTPHEDVPNTLLPLMSVMWPASDAHLYLALEWLERTGRRYGRDDPKVALPSEACLGALVLRYGRVSGALLTSIMTERCKVEYNLGRINLPTPWAASTMAAAS